MGKTKDTKRVRLMRLWGIKQLVYEERNLAMFGNVTSSNGVNNNIDMLGDLRGLKPNVINVPKVTLRDSKEERISKTKTLIENLEKELMV